jgi:large subunit ribosomal protein L30
MSSTVNEGNVKITLVKSLFGRYAKHVATAHSLGLRKIDDSTIQIDNDATKGKYTQICYLVKVERL